MKKIVNPFKLSLITLFAGVLASQAQITNTWNGSVDANWSTAANWAPGPLSPGDSLVFAGTAQTSPNNDTAANTGYGGITFDATAASSFDLVGSAIDFAGLIENDSSVPQAIDLGIVLTNASTVTTAAGDITIGLIAGGISGTGSLTVNGPGTLTVSNKTYSGGTIVNSGAKMIVENDNGNYTLAGGTLELTYGSWGSGANYTFTADSSLGVIAGGPNYNNRGRYDANGTVGSSGFKWTVVGDGRFQIVGGHVAAGSVEVTAPAVLGAIGNGNANITGLGTNTITVDNGAALRINNAGVVLAPIVLNGGDGPDHTGALVGNQEGYSGNKVNQVVATFSNTITLLNDNGDTSFGAQISDGNTNGSSLAIAGNITGPGGFVKIGAYPLILSGTNTYGGNTTINAGTVQVGSPGALPNGPTNGYVYVYGTSKLDINGFNATVKYLQDDNAKTATVDNSSASPASLSFLNGANFSGAVGNSGGGPLSIISSGGVSLLGANSYTGSNVVQSGSLEITVPTGTTGGLVSVADGATLQLDYGAANSSLQASSAYFNGTNSGVSLIVNLNHYPNPSKPVINATNGSGVVTINGTVNFSFQNFDSLSGGTIHLIQYTSLAGAGGFTQPSLGAGITATIVTNVSTKTIDLVVQQPILTWTGKTNNLWDFSTTNWIFTSISQAYADSNPILFDDTAKTNTVNLTAAVAPTSTLVNTTNTYTFTGAGPLNGGQLTLSGSGKLVLATTNASGYGNTIIGSGTLQVGNGGTNGMLSSGTVDDEATLAFNLANSNTVANVISGSGVVAQNNTNILALSGANTYSGGTLINQGVVQLGSANALGTPATGVLLATVASGASLNVNGKLVATTNATVISGAGFNNNGTVYNGGGGTCIGCGDVGINNVSLSADAVIGSANDWVIGASGLGISGNGHNVTKIGAGMLYLRTSATTAFGQFTIGAGGVLIESANPFGTATTLVISNNAFTDSWGNNSGSPSYTIPNNIIITNGGGQITTTRGHWWDRPDYDTYTGSITLNANLTVKNSSVYSGKPGQLNLTGPIVGSGNVTKTGAYLVTLSGANTYTGNTTISAGTLAISAITQGGGAYTNVDGATLDVPSQTGYVTVPMSSLALGSVNGSTLTLSRVTAFSATQAPITATNLALTGTNTLLLPAVAFAGGPGEYPLIKYTATSGTGVVAIGGGVRGVPGYLTNDTANSEIALVIPGGTPVVWTGSVNTNWDINATSNWKTNGVATTYLQPGLLGDIVTFDDSSSVTNVYLASSVSPTLIIVNNTNKLYTFSGNIITNATSLLKQGTGTLLLTNGANTFTGGATIIGGTVKLGNAGSLNNSSGMVTVSGNGALDLNNQQPTVLACTISGTGFNGLGTLVQNSGTDGANGPGSITLAGSATVGGTNRWDLRNGANKLVTPTNAYTLTKVGTGFNPVFVGTAVSSNLGDIYITAGKMGYETGTTGLGNPTNTIYISANASLEMYNATVPLNKFIVLSNGASILPDSGGGGFTPTTTQNILAGPIYLAGPNSGTAAKIGCNYYNGCAISNTISGPGGLTFDYNAYNRLYATNTYTGDTTIWGGVYMYANACIVSTNITINVGPLYVTNNAFAGVKTTFLNDNLGGILLAGNGSVNFAKMQLGGGGNQGYVDASARTDGTFTLPTNSLVYSGSAANNYIKGNLVVTTNSTLSVGNSGSAQVLSCSNNVTFQAGSTNYVDVNKTATVTNCDLLNVTGTLSFGGTLQIRTNGTVPLAANDSFKLFAAGSISGTFAVVAPTPGPNLMWDFSQLAVNGTLSVKAVTISPASPSVVYGNNVQLTASTTSGGTLTYQWYDNNNNAISGANSATLTVVKPPVAASGNYTVAITNGSSLAGSAVAQVTVTPAALTIGATNINKNFGVTYTFAGTEYTNTPLVSGDSITSVSLASAGAASGAAVNTYPITPSSAVGVGLVNYNITYVNGTLTVVQTLPATGTNITFGVSGNTLTLSWPTNYVGWLLQSNSVALANTNYWFTISNSVSTNQMVIPVNPALTNVFYRMVHP